jgi:hypothetical protein
MEDLSNYIKIKEDSKRFYDQIGKVTCPAFGQEVIFGSEGFDHLVHKNDSRERDKGVQIMKFKLLPLAKKLVGLTTTHQEYEEGLREFRLKKFKKIVQETKIVKYWGIIAILENRKFKVVVRKVGDNGQMHFWSVIPAWVTSQYRDIKLRSTMKGDPTDD